MRTCSSDAGENLQPVPLRLEFVPLPYQRVSCRSSLPNIFFYNYLIFNYLKKHSFILKNPNSFIFKKLLIFILFFCIFAKISKPVDIAPNISYVLMTQEGTYLVEYLIGEVVFTSSISRAMIFSDVNIALKFKTLLYDRFKIKVSVNTYIY